MKKNQRPLQIEPRRLGLDHKKEGLAPQAYKHVVWKNKMDGMSSVVIADTLPFSMVINHIERLGKSGSNPFDKENSFLTFFSYKKKKT